MRGKRKREACVAGRGDDVSPTNPPCALPTDPHPQVTERRKTQIHRKCQITPVLIADDVGGSGQQGQGVLELPAPSEDVRDPCHAGGVIRDASGADWAIQ